VVIPEGGWSLLVDAEATGTDAPELSTRLLEHGRIAATPMTAWGSQVAPRYVRLVYRNPRNKRKQRPGHLSRLPFVPGGRLALGYRVAALDSPYGSSFRSTKSSVPRFRSCCLAHPPRFAVHIPRRGTKWQQEP
jgi:hypothetical protein